MTTTKHMTAQDRDTVRAALVAEGAQVSVQAHDVVEGDDVVTHWSVTASLTDAKSGNVVCSLPITSISAFSAKSVVAELRAEMKARRAATKARRAAIRSTEES